MTALFRSRHEVIKASKVVLAGDIGGTNARFGLFAVGEGSFQAVATATFPSRSLLSLDEGLKRFLHDHPTSVTSACFGVAGPVIRGVCHVTNLPWIVSEEDIRREFGFEKVVLVNDLVATAHAVESLTEEDVLTIQQGQADPSGNIVLLAPGTGLGVSFLFNIQGSMYPVASQGGHVDFAPTSDQEIYIFQRLRKRFPRVSLESVASGSGIVEIYRALRQIRQVKESYVNEMDSSEPISADVITRRSVDDSDPLCLETVRTFLSVVGSAAGNLILTCMATKGLYMAGGILPRVIPIVREGGLMDSLLNKGQFRDLLSQVPVHLILNQSAGLLGAARVAARC